MKKKDYNTFYLFKEGKVVDMYNNYVKKSETTKETLYAIMDYYEYLFKTFEVKSVSEIAEALEIHPKTLRVYLEKLYTGKNSYGKYSKISLRILLCTKFSTQSLYYEDQKELRPIIKKREIVKILKSCENKRKLK